LAEALSDLGASLGFSALALEVARTGEAFWVGFFVALGYLTLGPLLFLSPWVERQGLARALLKLRLARGLLFLPLLFLPREAALLVLYSYPLMVLTDLAIVAWEGLLVRRDRGMLAERSGKLYAAWEVGGLAGMALGPVLFVLHPALPYLLSTGILLLLAWTLLRSDFLGEEERKEGEAKLEGLGRALRRLLACTPLRPYLLISLFFTLAHALATALLGLLYEVLPLPSSKQGELKPRPFR
jgi:tetrahydromethanopterin S-methyltransferase subunit F